MAANALSATRTIYRSGSQRWICRAAWRAHQAASWVPHLTGIEAFGGGEQSEKGNAMTRSAPGPSPTTWQKAAQAAGFDEVSLGRADRVAIDTAGADLGSPTPFNGDIKPDHDRGAGRHQGLYQHDQQLARHSSADHAARLRIRWKVQKSGSHSRPRMRSAAETVRRPGAKMTPASSIRTFDQVGRVNRSANSTSRDRKRSGSGDPDELRRR